MRGIGDVIAQIHQLRFERSMRAGNLPLLSDMGDVFPFMTVHPCDYQPGERIFIDAKQHRIGQIESVNVLSFLQKHDQPKIVRIPSKCSYLRRIACCTSAACSGVGVPG